MEKTSRVIPGGTGLWIGLALTAMLGGSARALESGLALQATAQGDSTKTESKNRGDFLELFESGDWATLYKNKQGPLEKWSLIGRFDLQFGHLNSDEGDADKFELRRLRFGSSLRFLDNWRVKVVADLVDEDARLDYGGILTAYLRYRVSKHLKFKLGKQVPHFTQEWSTPSMDLGVIERSLLVQQVRPRRATGLTVVGDWRRWDFELGAFSGEQDQELGSLDAGFFYLANLGYDFTDIFDWWKDFDLRFYYLYNDGDTRNTAVKPYKHSFSTAVKLRKKRFRLGAEAIYADGLGGRPNAWGFLVTPSWELIDDKLDLVLRYHYAKGKGRDGLRPRSRYESLAPTLTDRGRGEEYHSLYLGLKCHLVEDRLLLLTGGEWSSMHDDYGDGGDLGAFTLLSAMRFAF